MCTPPTGGAYGAGTTAGAVCTVRCAGHHYAHPHRETQEKEERSASPSDDEGWTVLTKKNPEAGEGIKIPLPTVYSPLLTPTETSTAVETNTNVTNNASTTTDPFGPSATAQTVQPEPRIQVALKAMMNMGFSNEGNWLANLIEVKDGDITKVLDILQVVKK